jgi:hypothetical protein
MVISNLLNIQYNIKYSKRGKIRGTVQGLLEASHWKAIGDRLPKPCYLNRGDHNRKIRARKQKTDVGKFSFINRTIKSWNQFPASLLASFPCKLNTFRKRVKNVTSKRIANGD